ncbi:MAG TPA: hypothetical protein VN661_04965 [Candidatus Acidoferrales bacterium]|nr:hypothetical protein [Candidatus Acidoferrales bacterium]
MPTKSEPFVGRYLSHFHTLHTDGKLSLEDYFSFAAAHAVERLILLEHIRSQPTYDVALLSREFHHLSDQRSIPASFGFEVKLLPGGTLDISPEHLQLASVIGIAEHGFPPDVKLLQSVLPRAFECYQAMAPEKTFVWVHPGTTFRKLRIQPEKHPAYRALLEWAQGAGLLIERNLRYGLAPDSAIQRFGLRNVVLGADAHTAADLDAWLQAAAPRDATAASQLSAW